MSKYSKNMPPDLKAAIGWFYDTIKPQTKFLDFGCSTGYFGSIIKNNKNCVVDGVEISEDIKQARKVLDKVYSFDLDGDWPKAIFEKQYDYLFFGDVLEHLKDPGVVLQKAAKLLRPNGKVFVSVPNIAHISIRLELMGGNFEKEPMGILDSTHLKYFTLRSFSELAQDAGYEVASVDYTVNDYPDEVLRKALEKLDLKPDKKFWKMVESKEARAFQYKFVLKPGLKSKKLVTSLLPTKPLPEKLEQFRDSYLDDLRNQAQNLRAHAEEQAKIIKELDLQNKLLKKRIVDIESTKLYKLYKAIRRKKSA